MLARTLAPRLAELARSFPAVFLTGPRQSGKTTLARLTFPEFRYLSLEDLETRQEALEDPRGFLRRLEGRRGVILDEVQRTPDLFSYLQGFLDEERGGPVVLTGSQHFLLSERISQSLAGRAAILELMPLSLAELTGRPSLRAEQIDDPSPLPADASGLPDLDDILVRGLFPRIHDRGLDASAWLDAYVRTYVERDVRLLSNVGDLEVFTRFVALCAGRTGRLLNTASLGSDAGISHTTVRRWISLLETGYVIALLRPHHDNFRKRMVKSPKLYFLDTGVLCHLLGIHTASDLRHHPLRGAVFECFIVSELRKQFLHHGKPAPLTFWRDTHGHEIDIVVDLGTRRIPIEVKSGETVASDAFKNIDFYLSLSGGEHGVLIYGGKHLYRRRGHVVRPWWACS